MIRRHNPPFHRSAAAADRIANDSMQCSTQHRQPRLRCRERGKCDRTSADREECPTPTEWHAAYARVMRTRGHTSPTQFMSQGRGTSAIDAQYAGQRDGATGHRINRHLRTRRLEIVSQHA